MCALAARKRAISIYHTGDLGDIIAFLPILRRVSKSCRVHFVLGPTSANSPRPREPIGPSRFNFIAPLLRAQDYIGAVIYDPDGQRCADFDAGSFRNAPYYNGLSLIDWQARFCGVALSPADLAPWISAPIPCCDCTDAVLIRSLRYHNPNFDWPSRIRGLSDAIFLGLPEEWDSFRATVAPPGYVRYRRVWDALEYAAIVSRARRVITNQTFGYWVAVGLGKPVTLEGYGPSNNCDIGRANVRIIF